MSKKRSYTKRFTQDETISIIRARIKMNDLFSGKRFNLRKAWEAVGREAQVEVEHQWLYKKWANLLAIYKKCLELQNGDEAATSDGEISAASWVYFEEMDKWASSSKNANTTEFTPEVFNTKEGAHENEKIISIYDEDLYNSIAETSMPMDGPVTPSDMSPATSDDAVSQILQSWGLSDLKAKFKANYIVLQAFEYLTEEDIVELIPKIGQRAIFRGRLQQWRTENGIATKPPTPQLPPQSPASPKLSPQPASPQLSPQPAVSLPQKSPPTTEPPIKMIKLEPVDDYSETQPQPKLLVRMPTPTKLRVLLPKPHVHQAVNGSKKTPPPPPRLVHKIYGTLTKCNQKPNQIAKCTPKVSAMQSKVKQFYISPAVEPSSTPSLAPPPSLVEDDSPNVFQADFGPFVTSIIRVETNCDKTYQKNVSSLNPQTKVNRTTILQKLTSPSSTPVSPQEYAPQKCNPPQQYKPKKHTSLQKTQQSQTKHSDEEQLDSCPLYPIVKLETELGDTNSNESMEPLSELEPQSQPNIKLEPVQDRSPEKATLDSTGFQAEFIESLESSSAQMADSEEDSKSRSISKLKRIAPEVFRKSRKRHAKIMGKLDIRKILMNSEQGRQVLVFYDSYEILDVSRRRKLIDAISQYCWLTNKHIIPTDCNKIADEIIEIFPNEKKEDYCLLEPGKNPKSPLYTKYRNMSQSFFIENNLPIPKRRKIKPRLSLELAVEDIEVDDSFIIS